MEARAVTLAVRGPLARDELPGLVRRACVLLAHSDAPLIVCDVGGLPADAVAVDALARLQLAARRQGRRIHLANASNELLDLVRLVGLSDVLS